MVSACQKGCFDVCHLHSSHRNAVCVRHFTEFIRIADKVAVGAVPEVDVHNAVRNPDILLFGSFTQPVRILTGDEFLELRFFIFGQQLGQRCANSAEENSVKALKIPFQRLDLCDRRIAPVKVAAVAIFFFINVTDDEPPFRHTQIFNK